MAEIGDPVGGQLGVGATPEVIRARGEALGPLDGIPYTAKDSYKVKGLTVAAGSPAFRDLVAGVVAEIVGIGRAQMPVAAE